jgi:hypothetical protein
MRRLLAASLALAALACDPPPPPNDDGCTGDWFADFLRAGDPTTADLQCVGDALGRDDLVDAACAQTATVAADVVDHESSDPIADVPLEVFFGDDAEDDADVDTASDTDGVVSFDAPLCAPLSYRTTRTDEDARVTVGLHELLAPGDAPQFSFRSVRESTVGLIGFALGQELTAGTGIVFGKATGCDGDAAVDRVQVIVRDADCQVPEGFAAGYTTNRVPDAFLASTSEEGFFFAMNIPPGDWTLEGYVPDGDSFRLIAAAPIAIAADEITLADLALGRDDGLVVPPACRDGC